MHNANRVTPSADRRLAAALLACALLASLFHAVPGFAAAPPCDSATARAAAPRGVRIGPIENLNPELGPPPNGARLVEARGKAPAHCLVTGSVVTHAASNKTANFGLALPLAWNGKLLFSGCSGYCGVVFQNLPDAAGGGSPESALARGYAIVSTDSGHASPPGAHAYDASWALLAPGKPDTEALTDYFHRAVHAVAAASKPFVQKWYSRRLSRSYFFGCSEGGRQAMMEAALYPTDFDGYIAGAPAFDLPGHILSGRGAQALLAAPEAVIPPELLRLTDNLIYASCDELDGVRDRLIQNPGRCSFRPETLLCEGDNGTACLTAQQVRTLETWFSAARDAKGRVVSHGFPVSDLYNDGAEGANLFRWLASGPSRETNAAALERSFWQQEPSAWTFMDAAMKYLVHRDPSFSTEQQPPVNRRGVIRDETLELIVARTDAGSSDTSARLGAFLQADRKLLLYHGQSDGWVSPFRTTRFYRTWAERSGGYDVLQGNARLFTVPGMYHCSHGPGPNVFDALGALEQWVENGAAPDEMIALKYEDDRADRPVLRSMPLCPFPTQARYAGEGDVSSAANWTCSPNADLLRVGSNGVDAGLIGPTR